MLLNICHTEFVNKDEYFYAKCGSKTVNVITLGNMSYIVSAAYGDGSNGKGHVLVGRYTSIAHGVTFNLCMNHDYNSVANYPLDVHVKKMSQQDVSFNRKKCNKNQIIVGNDVWIGSDVKIYGGRTIGNGAILAGGSVITKDVPPYAIVGGNPAGIIKYRFSKEIIDKLQSIKWWYWPIDKISQNFDLMKEPELFCNAFYKNDVLPQNNAFSNELADLRINGYKIYYMVADCDANSPLYTDIINCFSKQYSLSDKKILIIFSEYEKNYKKIEKMCSKIDNIYVYYDENITDMSFVKNIDYFITTREGINSQYVDYCSNYGVKILSALDYDIFD